MKVHNKYHNTAPPDAVYIGRGSPWGNPYSTKPEDSKYCVMKVGTVQEALKKFKQYVLSDPQLYRRVQTELKGKHLVCFCKPEPCHGDVLFELANEEITC